MLWFKFSLVLILFKTSLIFICLFQIIDNEYEKAKNKNQTGQLFQLPSNQVEKVDLVIKDFQ